MKVTPTRISTKIREFFKALIFLKIVSHQLRQRDSSAGTASPPPQKISLRPRDHKFRGGRNTGMGVELLAAA
jgi:hypothetical protein